MFRSVRAVPTYSADWKGDYEEKAAEWFELFLDLMMVAVCSNVAHKLEAHLDGHGVANFLFMFSLYFATWQLYTHYNARFNESSLLHYVLLFGLLCGIGGMVLSSEPGNGFTFGLILTRLSVLGMYTNAVLLLPSTRPYLSYELGIIGAELAALVVSLAVGTHHGFIACYLVLLAVTFVVRPLVIVHRDALHSAARIPLNIDHYSERFGCIVLVVLGEAVLNSIIKLDQKDHDGGDGVTARFYATMVLSLLIVFALAIFYFGTQPPRELHALRRSVYHGMGFSYIHYVLLAGLLAFGTAITILTEEASVYQPMHAAQVWLLFGSLSVTMASILLIRLFHFGGRSVIATDMLVVQRIKRIWWCFAFSAPVVPLVCAGAALAAAHDDGHLDPLAVLAVAFGSLSLMLVGEITIMAHLSSYKHGHVCSHTHNEAGEAIRGDIASDDHEVHHHVEGDSPRATTFKSV
ncbi:Aste57867_22389 [Aphanomyces stellatus]|uniref:Aste57867_22389 protein n=1 Tax=Aphanomyces stellatus TaxID=120398 RepID=A0A485LJY4_9STRA|nr:hypothetical protein As57867_022319 [Aphanomyces stellatus]VFT99052.1 Aste57867_22389 [Aphanomyces stellatus]